LLQPYFHGRLGPKTFLVGPETAHEIGKKLPAYGPPSAATCSLLVLNHFLQPTTVEWRVGDDI
jgi:hypothetical protein